MHLDIERLPLKDLTDGGMDHLHFVMYRSSDHTHLSKNYTPPREFDMQLKREVRNHADLRRQKLDLLPGFRFTWYYSGMEVKSELNGDFANPDFARKGSMNFYFDSHLCLLHFLF